MPTRSRRSLIAGIEALNYAPDYQVVQTPAGDQPRLFFDGVRVVTDDYIQTVNTDVNAGTGLGRIYAIDLDLHEGFHAFRAGAMMGTKVADDSDSPQKNVFMWHNANFVLKSASGMAQLIGLVD